MDCFSVHGLYPKGFLDGALFHDKVECVREEKGYRQIEQMHENFGKKSNFELELVEFSR